MKRIIIELLIGAVAMVLVCFFTYLVWADVPVYEQIETKNSVEIIATGFEVGKGFYRASCYVGYRDAEGVFSPDNLGVRKVEVQNWQDNFLLRDMNAALWTRIRAVENDQPLMQMSIIVEAYWRLLLEKHLLGETPLHSIDFDTDIETYVEEMIADMGGASYQPVLTIPDTLALGAESEGVITIENTGTGTLVWQSTNVNSRISLSAPNGMIIQGASLDLTVEIDRSGLPAGEHSGNFTIQSNGGNQVVAVTITVAPAELTFAPDSLAFEELNTQKTFTISNTGELDMQYQLTPGNARITLSGDTGTLEMNEEAIITVTVDKEGLPAGTHNSQVSINSTGGNGVVAIQLVIE